MKDPTESELLRQMEAIRIGLAKGRKYDRLLVEEYEQLSHLHWSLYGNW